MKNTNNQVSNKNLHKGSFTSQNYFGVFRFRSFDYDLIDAMISRNRGLSMVGIFLRMIPAMQGKVSKTHPILIKSMLRKICQLKKDQGLPGMVKYLKACSVLLQQSISGHKVVTFSPRVSRTNSGLPRLLPVNIRRLIRRGQTLYMKLSLTVLSVFRDLHYDSKPNLSSITNPFNGNVKYVKLVIQYIPRFVSLFTKGKDPRQMLDGRFKFFSILKSSPQVPHSSGWPFNGMASTNPIVIMRSLVALTDKQVECMLILYRAIRIPEFMPNGSKPPVDGLTLDESIMEGSGDMDMMDLPTPDTSTKYFDDLALMCQESRQLPVHLYKYQYYRQMSHSTISFKGYPKVFFDEVLEIAKAFVSSPGVKYAMSTLKCFNFKHYHTGKLGYKQEAAGKMRVFAMVDPWTQWVMYPYHKVLFKILSLHNKVDGTFNQLNPLKRAFIGHKPLFSMDLSSATDRLPISIQVPLFKKLFRLNDSQAEAWKELMVGRAYLDPKSGASIRYAVGQPMGALSSWAMLAVTHHLIVQVAAWSSGFSTKRLFLDYALLGDDIVIFNAKVSKKYHEIISGLGVECNLNKSIISPKGIGLEFAKKTLYKGIDVSPVPLKEFHSSLEGILPLIEFGRKYSLSFAKLLSVAGFGFKVKGSCNQPLYKLSLKVRYLYLSLIMMDPDTLLKTIKGLYKNAPSLVHINLVTAEWVDTLMVKFLESLDKSIKKVESLNWDILQKFLLNGEISNQTKEGRVYSLMSLDHYKLFWPNLSLFWGLLYLDTKSKLRENLVSLKRDSSLVYWGLRTLEKAPSLQDLMRFYHRYLQFQRSVVKIQPDLVLSTPEARKGVVRLPSARPGVLRRYMEMSIWNDSLKQIHASAKKVKDPNLSTDIPSLESGIPIFYLLDMLRRIFFTAGRSHPAIRGLQLNLFRRFILPNIPNFGVRSLLWVWLIECGYTIITTTLILSIFWILWVILTWFSGDDSLSSVLLMALPKSLSGIPGIKTLSEFFFGSVTPTAYSFKTWLTYIASGLLIHMSFMFVHFWQNVTEVVTMNADNTWAGFFGLHIGLQFLLILDPILEILKYPILYPIHRGAGAPLANNLLIMAYSDLFTYLVSEVKIIYSVMCHGVHPWYEHGISFTLREVSAVDGSDSTVQYNDPWLSTAGPSVENSEYLPDSNDTDPVEDWSLVENVEPFERISYFNRVKWLLITKPHWITGLSVAVYMAFQVVPSLVGA